MAHIEFLGQEHFSGVGRALEAFEQRRREIESEIEKIRSEMEVLQPSLPNPNDFANTPVDTLTEDQRRSFYEYLILSGKLTSWLSELKKLKESRATNSLENTELAS